MSLIADSLFLSVSTRGVAIIASANSDPRDGVYLPDLRDPFEALDMIQALRAFSGIPRPEPSSDPADEGEELASVAIALEIVLSDLAKISRSDRPAEFVRRNAMSIWIDSTAVGNPGIDVEISPKSLRLRSRPWGSTVRPAQKLLDRLTSQLATCIELASEAVPE